MTTGAGMYTSAAAAMIGVKEALLAVATSALAGEKVDVRVGFVWPAQYPDQVSLTRIRWVPEAAVVGPRRRRNGEVSVDVEIWSHRVTNDERVPHGIAFGLLAKLEAAVLADPTLVGRAQWCFIGETDSDGITTEDDLGEGRATGIVATFEAHVIVTT